MTSRSAERPPAPLSLLGLIALRRVSLIVSLVVFVAAGLAIGYVAPVQYTAQSQLLAGGTSVSAAAVPSFAQAGLTLAQAYSRVFASDSVQASLRSAGYDPKTESVTASPIAGTSVILVEAQAPSEATAVRLANVGSKALRTTIAELLDNSALMETTRARLKAAYATQVQAQTQLDTLNKRKNPEASSNYDNAVAELGDAKATVQALTTLLSTQVSDSVQANGLRAIQSGTLTATNSKQRYQFWGVLGLIAGAVVWLGFALVRSRQFRRREPIRRRSAPMSSL